MTNKLKYIALTFALANWSVFFACINQGRNPYALGQAVFFSGVFLY